VGPGAIALFDCNDHAVGRRQALLLSTVAAALSIAA